MAKYFGKAIVWGLQDVHGGGEAAPEAPSTIGV
jgi:hypothetical protein